MNPADHSPLIVDPPSGQGKADSKTLVFRAASEWHEKQNVFQNG
jgi:hypothetical protein